MTTLDTAPLAALLHQLFIDADTTSALLKQQLDALPTVNRPSRLFNFRTCSQVRRSPIRQHASVVAEAHAARIWLRAFGSTRPRRVIFKRGPK